MANDSIRGRQVVYRFTNKSGGGLVEGDVVIVSSADAASVTTTTTAGLNTDVIGVALETIAGDAIGRICIAGYVPKINLSGAASLGDTFATHTVAKQAAPAAARAAGHFGEVLGTGTTPAAILWGAPDAAAAVGGGDVATDEIWDAAGDIVQGTGSDTAARLAIGTAGQFLKVNAAATALEYATGARVFIAEVTPTNTTASFTSIPATYTSLYIEFIARSDKAAVTVESISIYFNNDTTATNYYYTNVYALDANAFGNEANTALIADVTAATAPANDAAIGYIKIPYYAKTTFNKAALGFVGERRASNTMATKFTTVYWTATTAINRVDIITASAGNYIAGSTFRLYGEY